MFNQFKKYMLYFLKCHICLFHWLKSIKTCKLLLKTDQFMQVSQPQCELSKLIIRYNIGPISAAKSRLLLLVQCRRLHGSSAGPATAAFVHFLYLSISSRNLAQYWPYTKLMSLLLWHSVPKVEEPDSGP